MNIGFNRLYYGAVAFVVSLIAFFSAQMSFGPVMSLVFSSTYPLDRAYVLSGAREQLVSNAATILIALPIWWFHWKRWRKLSEKESKLFRLYLYTLMIVSLIVVTFQGASTLSALLRFILGIPSSSSSYSYLQDVCVSLLGVLVGLATWVFHARVSRQTESA